MSNETETQSMHFMCSLCQNKVDVDEAFIRREDIHGSSEQNDDNTMLSLLKCKHCDKDVMILRNNNWVSVDEALQQLNVSDGIHEMKDHSEHVTLYILINICHNQYDFDPDLQESPFRCHSSTELGWLLWKNGEAVGFYTIKNKGDLLYDTPYCRYNLTMLDTIYVRQHFRHQGFGTQLIRHFLAGHSEEDVGFSAPLSHNLLAVLHKLLLTDIKLRDHVWECSYDGSEGYRRNVWLYCKSMFECL